MNETLYWRGYRIEVLQRFTNAINFRNPFNGLIDQRPINEFSEDIDASLIEPEENTLTINIGTDIIDVEVIEERQSINPAPTRLALPSSENENKSVNLQVKVNSYSLTQTDEFAKKLKGVGRQTSKVILESKPIDGYKDFQQFKSIVEPKIKQALNWSLLESQIDFS